MFQFLKKLLNRFVKNKKNLRAPTNPVAAIAKRKERKLIIVFGELHPENSLRGRAASEYQKTAVKLSSHLLQQVSRYKFKIFSE